MAVPYTQESDATSDGWAKITTTENGVSRTRFEKIIDGRVVEQSIPTGGTTYAALEHWRSDRANKGKQA